MASNPFRESGTVDMTEVKLTQIRESEETKRRALKEKLEARKQSRLAWMEWYRQSDAVGVILVLPVVTVCVLTIMFYAHLWFAK